MYDQTQDFGIALSLEKVLDWKSVKEIITYKTKKYMNFSAQQVELCCVVLHKTTHDAKRVQKNKFRNMVGKVGLVGYLGETSNTPHQTLSITLLGHFV